jgi:hypothetical protein
MPLLNQEEEKKQEAPREEAVEYIDTSSNPQPLPAQLPAPIRATGLRKIQTAEESKTEAFMTAKVDNPEARRIQVVEQMRKDKRRGIVSKKRQAHVPDQLYERISSTSTRSTSRYLVRRRISDMETSCRSQRIPLTSTLTTPNE